MAAGSTKEYTVLSTRRAVYNTVVLYITREEVVILMWKRRVISCHTFIENGEPPCSFPYME